MELPGIVGVKKRHHDGDLLGLGAGDAEARCPCLVAADAALVMVGAGVLAVVAGWAGFGVVQPARSRVAAMRSGLVPSRSRRGHVVLAVAGRRKLVVRVYRPCGLAGQAR